MKYYKYNSHLVNLQNKYNTTAIKEKQQEHHIIMILIQCNNKLYSWWSDIQCIQNPGYGHPSCQSIRPALFTSLGIDVRVLAFAALLTSLGIDVRVAVLDALFTSVGINVRVLVLASLFTPLGII